MNKYQLNVAYKIGQRWLHYCRIDLPETSEAGAIEKAQQIKQTFGTEFNVTMTCWNQIGRHVEV